MNFNKFLLLKRSIIDIKKLEEKFKKEQNRLHDIEAEKGNDYYWATLIKLYPKYKELYLELCNARNGKFKDYTIPSFDCMDYGGEYCLDKIGLQVIIDFLESED